MVELLHEAARVLRPEQIWVNPDCGLKTRAWAEIEASLRNMVQAAKQLREELVPAPRARLAAPRDRQIAGLSQPVNEALAPC